MPKKTTKPPKKEQSSKLIKNSAEPAKSLDPQVQNGLAGAIWGTGFPGAGFGFGGPTTQEVSQPGQIFDGLRWYFISNFRQMLSEAYVELGLVQTVVNVPVDDAFRGGVTVETKELTPEQLKQLQDKSERLEDVSKVSQGRKWCRLFGGAGVLILTDQDPETPLDMDAIGPGANLDFRAVDMWELYFDQQNTAGYNPAIQDEKYEWFSYYGTKVHKSRVIKMKGLDAPSFLRPRLRGWGFSVIEALVRSINQYLEGTGLIYELVDEAKIDVFGIKNLTNTLLSPTGTAQVAARIQLANKEKDFQHALVMDAEDTYEQKTLTFSGLADVMKEIRMQVASDLRMPITKLFGISAAGFNSGEDDIEIYNGMIESTIRSQAKIDVLRIMELRCQQMFGFIPSDLTVSFKPLRVLSLEQEEKVKDSQFNRLHMSVTAGLISLEQFQEACNAHNLLGVKLDPENLPEGSDEIGNVPGQDEAEIDKDAEKEDNKSTLGFMDKAQKSEVKKDAPKKD